MALADSLHVESAEQAAIDGHISLAAHGGGFRWTVAPADVHAVFANVTGRLSLLTWTRYVTPVGDPASPADFNNETIPLSGQDLVFTASGGSFAMQGLVAGGTARIDGGPIDSAGRPAVLGAPDFDLSTMPSWVERVNVDLMPGWSVARVDAGASSWPLPTEPRLVLEGGMRFQVSGGTVEFTDSEGKLRRVPLGDLEGSAAAGAGPVRSRRLVFDGSIDGGAFPLAGSWVLAAPRLEWAVQGVVQWRQATGEAVVDGRRHAIEGVDVAADFDARGVPEPTPDAAQPAPDRYDLEGDIHALRLDGRPVSVEAAPSAVAQAASPAVSVLALAFLFLTKAGQTVLAHGALLFSRIPVDRLLENPVRRRMLDTATAEPGIYMRELHRRIGGAWGPFTFHLRLLERAGHVLLVRDGRFTIVVAGTAHPRVPHPVARAVLEALPVGGEPLDLQGLARRLGRARSVVAYHVAALVRRGLAERRPMTGRRMGVSRIEPH